MQFERLSALASALEARPPWCSGSVPVPAHCVTLFYGKETAPRRINLLHASEAELAELARACEPATFGLDQADVLDESYRKAGKLDVGDFATPFELGSGGGPGILDLVRRGLVEEVPGEDKRPVYAELYKLNVYGPGSFFRAHKDTPRAANMFGSLVLAFPTAHTGGALILRTGTGTGLSHTVDSGAAAQAMTTPGLVYAAFYSDVEHEVAPVAAGYRVTLTYNLYFANADANTPDAARAPGPDPVPTNELLFRTALAALLADPSFLPDGGSLGFGLAHQYPVPSTFSGRDSGALARVLGNLKGRDALLHRACTAAGLRAALHAVYNDKGLHVLTDRLIDLRGLGEIEGGLANYLRGLGPPSWREVRESGRLVHVAQETVDEFLLEERCGRETHGRPLDEEADRTKAEEHFKLDEHVLWATPLNTVNSVEVAYVRYGNQASIDFAYLDLCMVVKVGKPGEREIIREAQGDGTNK